jgi:hypothetical protein
MQIYELECGADKNESAFICDAVYFVIYFRISLIAIEE